MTKVYKKEIFIFLIVLFSLVFIEYILNIRNKGNADFTKIFYSVFWKIALFSVLRILYLMLRKKS